MTEQEINHVNTNREIINMWIETHASLQPSNDILIPLIAAYERETEYRIKACPSCLVDCLIWCRMNAKIEPINFELTNPKKKKVRKQK